MSKKICPQIGGRAALLTARPRRESLKTRQQAVPRAGSGNIMAALEGFLEEKGGGINRLEKESLRESNAQLSPPGLEAPKKTAEKPKGKKERKGRKKSPRRPSKRREGKEAKAAAGAKETLEAGGLPGLSGLPAGGLNDPMKRCRSL